MKVLLYEHPFGRSLSAVHAYELWEEMRRLGVQATFLTEEPKLPEMVARVSPRLAGDPPRLRWSHPRTIITHSKFRLQKLQPFRSLATLYSVHQREQVLLRQAELYDTPDLVYRRHNYLCSETDYAHAHGIPVVTEVNGITQDEAKLAWWASPVSNRIVQQWEALSFQKADHYIVVSDHLKDVLVERFAVSEDKVTVILNGVNVNRFRPGERILAKNRLGLNPDCTYILFSGSLQPWQGVEHVIKAMPIVRSKFPSVQLLIVGSGIEHQRLQVMAGESVKFCGQVPYREVSTYMAASTVCVMPYTVNRNNDIGISPLKMCEYLACGRPVVASDIRGLGCIQQEECGLLVPPENPKAMAAAICELLGNRQRAAWMGQNGRRYVVENRSWKMAAEKTLAVCQKVKEEYDL